MSQNQLSNEAEANNTFNLDFSTLESADVLENFDFDSFLNSSAGSSFNFGSTDHTENNLTALYTISEDFTEGKLTSKEKGLRNLVKENVALSGFSQDKSLNQATKHHTQAGVASIRNPKVTCGHLQMGHSFLNPEQTERFSHMMKHATELSDTSVTDTGLPRRPVKRQKNRHSVKADGNSTNDGNGSSEDDIAANAIDKTGTADQFEYSGMVKVIYMIHCPYHWTKNHTAMAYQDLPSFQDESCSDASESQFVHANGSMPIYDLIEFFKLSDKDAAIIVVRHIRCLENQPVSHAPAQPLKWHESLVVKSPVLGNAIAAVAQCYYDATNDLRSGHEVFDNQMERLTIVPVKLFLFHHHQLLVQYATNHPHVQHHVRALTEYCFKNYASDFQEAQRLSSQGLVSQKHLEKLYRPNDIVISHEDGHVRAYVVSEWPIPDNGGGLSLNCWHWKNDGTGWLRHRQTLQVAAISNAHVSIDTLDVHPIKFTSTKTREILLERGRKLWNLKNASYISYTGYDIKGEDYYPESRFMIDYAVYKKMHEYASALTIYSSASHRHDPWPLRLGEGRQPSSEELILMPHVVHGFYLTEKQWLGIFVDGTQSIKWNKQAYDRLVLSTEKKELIKALVTVRTSQRGTKHGLGMAGKRVDIIAGKGNGLIMLLHGGPGTGKSLTGESVAEIAEMPLYRVTCGDIGTTPEAVEKYMSIVMHLGVTWNCVLLLDEADVFLEERSMSDLARNSLVSVFLRILEYYDGILILTSNRIGTIDEAFRSRIQVALHFEKLTIPSRRKIWTNFIDMLEEDKEEVDFQELRSKLDYLAKIDLNGRQIRNTMTTARQIAIYQDKRLDWLHLQQALSVSAEFNEYTRKLQGHTDEQRAREQKLR